MSFKTKTIVLLILLSLVPYVVTMGILGSAYRHDMESQLMANMNYQLGITIDRLDQSLLTLQNDMNFMASLDIMNDVLSGDIDKRIVNVLQQKKTDLALAGDFAVVDTKGTVIASSDVNSIGTAFTGTPLLRVALHSTFGDAAIGELLVRYDMDNLTRYFANDEHLAWSLLVGGERFGAAPTTAAALTIEGHLHSQPGMTVRLEQDRSLAFAALDKLTRSFLFALAIGTALIATIAFMVANYILHPILLLASTARAITETQDYSKRVQVARGDEIGKLAAAFNSMIGGMQDMIVRVKEEGENKLKLAQEKNRAEMLQSLSNKLAKYLSPQIYQSIFSGEKDVTLGSSRKKLTIFFSDIVNFTGTTDQMESEDLTQLLNHYLREMTDIALSHGATIDKYIGDAIMIFFGDPHSRGVADDARYCVEMALAMQRKVRELQELWRATGYTKPFSIRIGIHTGYCTVGNFGTENRMDYTIVGSSVNLASRIQTSAAPGTILISEDTCLLVRDRFTCLPVASVTPKGFIQPVLLYQVMQDDLSSQFVNVEQTGFHLQYQPGLLTPESRELLLQELEKLRGGHNS